MYSRFRPHPWHGLSAGIEPPRRVNAYIEITPADTIKYEIDKESGYLKVDRPQLTSSVPPVLYGFIPQTYCFEKVAALSKKAKRGDGDPLDICVFSERAITRSEVVVPVRVIGGFRMLDRGEADDKIIAVLENDPFWADADDLKDLPKVLRDRLQHYFLTYKLVPGQKSTVTIEEYYSAAKAARVIEAALGDYRKSFGRES